MLAMAMVALPNISSFVVHPNNSSRRRLAIEAIASPLEQIKLDFLGSLTNAYDLNPTNAASASFLSSLVEQATPESITRDMVESFEQLGTGKWRIVYVDDFSTSFGFGSLVGDLNAGEAEVGNDGIIESTIQCSNPTPYQLSLNGSFGTARNNMIIKVSNAQSSLIPNDIINAGPLGSLKGISGSITQSVLEKNWERIFAGVVIIDLAFIDDNLVVFDLDLLARVKGKRICARKEPDFF